MADLLIDHIVSDSSGKPRVRGSGVAVKVIAELHNLGWAVEKLADHLELTPAQVYAALSYYYDHKVEMDMAIQAGQVAAESVETLDALKARLEARQG